VELDHGRAHFGLGLFQRGVRLLGAGLLLLAQPVDVEEIVRALRRGGGSGMIVVLAGRLSSVLTVRPDRRDACHPAEERARIHPRSKA
jgi:hypothetical protein